MRAVYNFMSHKGLNWDSMLIILWRMEYFDTHFSRVMKKNAGFVVSWETRPKEIFHFSSLE